jgi:hypothetical protein
VHAAAASGKPQAAAAAAASAKVNPQRTLVAPKSATEFLTVAKSLLPPKGVTAGVNRPQSGTTQPQQQQQQQGQLGQYVKLLEPSQYPVVFKSGLTPNDAPLLLQGLQQIAADDPGFAEQCIRALPKVPRFEMVYTMLDKGSKGIVRDMVGQLEAAGRDVSGLKGSYRL